MSDCCDRPAGEECVCALDPLGLSVYQWTDEEYELALNGVLPVDFGPNDKPVFALEDVIAHYRKED